MIKLTILVLMLTVSVYGQDTNINNQGSVTINADSGSTGIGEVKIQTKGTDRITVTNSGNIGFGGVGASRLHFHTPCVKPETGFGRYCTDQLLTFTNNDSPHPDWQVLLGHSFQDNAPPSARPFHSLTIGYNAVGNPNDHGVGFNIETPYISGVGIEQTELYFWFNGRQGVTQNPGAVRPISMDANLATNAINLGLRSNGLAIGHQGFNNDWLGLLSSPNSGTMILQGNSKIVQGDATPAGTPPEWFIEKSGYGGILGHNTTRQEVLLSGSTGHLRLVGIGDGSQPVELRMGEPNSTTGILRFARGSSRWFLSEGGANFFELHPLARMSYTESSVPINTRLSLDWGRTSIGAGLSPASKLHVKNDGENVPTVIVEAAGWQSTPLQEWRNSSGVVIAKVDPDGSVWIKNGTGIKKIEIGSADSCGTGYKCLRIAN